MRFIFVSLIVLGLAATAYARVDIISTAPDTPISTKLQHNAALREETKTEAIIPLPRSELVADYEALIAKNAKTDRNGIDGRIRRVAKDMEAIMEAEIFNKAVYIAKGRELAKLQHQKELHHSQYAADAFASFNLEERRHIAAYYGSQTNNGKAIPIDSIDQNKSLEVEKLAIMMTEPFDKEAFIENAEKRAQFLEQFVYGRHRDIANKSEGLSREKRLSYDGCSFWEFLTVGGGCF